MKTSISVETTISVELSAQDVIAYVQEKKLVPDDWKFYSVEVSGNGISKGGKLVIKNTDSKPAIGKFDPSQDVGRRP